MASEESQSSNVLSSETIDGTGASVEDSTKDHVNETAIKEPASEEVEQLGPEDELTNEEDQSTTNRPMSAPSDLDSQMPRIVEPDVNVEAAEPGSVTELAEQSNEKIESYSASNDVATDSNAAEAERQANPAKNGQQAPGSFVTTKRQAITDSTSVAAVAHAFGKDLTLSGEVANDTKVEAQPAVQRGDSKTDTQKATATAADDANASGPSRGLKIGKGPPPTTQASEELPFDFNRFLEQMKHRSAQPVGEYVRSFIKGFAKKPYRTQDQIKLIFDFLDFIAARMREAEVWENLGETDFENAKEAMEKLVMNRLYPYTFTPAVQKEGKWAVQSDDLERDRILRQRIGLFGWLKEEHLDVPVGDHSRGFIEFSMQELNKINHYKAPRDKLICILNCCKVIFGMIRHLSTQENADTFIPVLIFVVLKANPVNLISNVEYISRFRNPDRLSSEAGYYLSSLMGAISFIETMDCTSLSNITQEEFETKMEEAMKILPDPEPHPNRPTLATSVSTPPRSLTPSQTPINRQRTVSSNSVSSPAGPGDESAKALPFTPIAATLADDTRAFFQRTGEAARTGLSRPMGALGRLINEGIEGIRTPSDSGASTPPSQQDGSTGMTASTSRSRIFAGLFGPAENAQSSGSVRSVSSGGVRTQQLGQQKAVGIDDEPPTPSTDGLTQEGFVPYNESPQGALLNSPARLLRPRIPQRGYSIDDAVFDDESTGRRNLVATRSARAGDDSDDDEDGEEFYKGSKSEETPNAAALERAKRRRQMQQDFGTTIDTYPGTPSRREALPDEREAQAYENAQTEEAIQQSMMDQEALGAVQAEEEAQNSAGVETLKSIFPTVDDGVIQMVLHGCEGNVELAIDRLLEMQ